MNLGRAVAYQTQRRNFAPALYNYNPRWLVPKRVKPHAGLNISSIFQPHSSSSGSIIFLLNYHESLRLLIILFFISATETRAGGTCSATSSVDNVDPTITPAQSDDTPLNTDHSQQSRLVQNLAKSLVLPQNLAQSSTQDSFSNVASTSQSAFASTSQPAVATTCFTSNSVAETSHRRHSIDPSIHLGSPSNSHIQNEQQAHDVRRSSCM